MKGTERFSLAIYGTSCQVLVVYKDKQFDEIVGLDVSIRTLEMAQRRLKVDRLPDRESDPYDAAYANPERLRAAGVRFAIVSDDADTSRNLPYEAAMAHAYGLPAAEAVRAITLSPAEILGVADSLGSIDPGKAATLVVATGDVLDHRTEVTHVFIDGVAQPLETRHTRLFREFKDRP